MQELIKVENGNIKMTSRNIAEWFDKRHADVMRDIRFESKSCGINIESTNAYFAPVKYLAGNGEMKNEYQLSKKGILLIGARYDAKLRLALIEKIEEFNNLTNLKSLVLSDNKISKIEGLEKLANLEELYLVENSIKKIEGLDRNILLQKIFLSNNYIDKIEGFDNLLNLKFSTSPLV